MSSSVHSRAVQRAAVLAGGHQALAERLALRRADIDAWAADERRPGISVLLRIVQVILEETDETG